METLLNIQQNQQALIAHPTLPLVILPQLKQEYYCELPVLENSTINQGCQIQKNRQVLMDRLTKQELGSQPNTEKRASQIQN